MREELQDRLAMAGATLTVVKEQSLAEGIEATFKAVKMINSHFPIHEIVHETNIGQKVIESLIQEMNQQDFYNLT